MRMEIATPNLLYPWRFGADVLIPSFAEQNIGTA
jgi:hypothetical protein